MAGYSSTPLARKLGVKPGARLALDAAPEGWSVPELPPGVDTAGEAEPADVVVAFFREAADLPERLPRLAGRIFPAGSLWVAWPRRAGGHESDITENGLRDHALPLGIVDTKVAALDDDWSGLKFMWRRELRSAGVTDPTAPRGPGRLRTEQRKDAGSDACSARERPRTPRSDGSQPQPPSQTEPPETV